MRRIFLVDTENIGTRFIPGKENLGFQDKIILFKNENHTPFVKILQGLNGCKASVETKEMANHSKNAMDFQICTCLGVLVNQYKTAAEYYIVSADRGYESSIEFVKNNMAQGLVIKEVINLKCEKAGENTKNTIDEMLSGFSKKARKEAAAGIKKTQNLCDYHNYLQKVLPIDGPSIYKIIKSQYEQLRLAL